MLLIFFRRICCTARGRRVKVSAGASNWPDDICRYSRYGITMRNERCEAQQNRVALSSDVFLWSGKSIDGAEASIVESMRLAMDWTIEFLAKD
jgi:hypothetical protein